MSDLFHGFQSLVGQSRVVGGEADPHLGQGLLEVLDLPVDLEIQEEEEDEGKQDLDDEVHPEDVDLHDGE